MGYPPLNTRKQKERQNKNLTTPAFLCYLDFTFFVYNLYLPGSNQRPQNVQKCSLHATAPPPKISKIT